MNVILIAQIATLILGLCTTAFSFYSAVEFSQVSGRLSKAIAGTLMGECFMGAMTTSFALMEMCGYIRHLPLEVSTGMRVVMFSLASGTTMVLVKELKRVHRA